MDVAFRDERYVQRVRNQKTSVDATTARQCNKMAVRGTFDDLTGRRFGRLAVKSYVGRDTKRSTVTLWLCVCECGTSRIVRACNLRSGHTTSCGCYRTELAKRTGRSFWQKHGHAGRHTATYRTWNKMKNRCLDPNDTNFPRYGGRGITVCEQWLDFRGFLADMGDRPEGTSIDRIDTNGNYEPSNCRWASLLTQANNTRANHVIEHEGVRHTASEWARITGIAASTITTRIRRGWSVSEALYTGVLAKGKNRNGNNGQRKPTGLFIS